MQPKNEFKILIVLIVLLSVSLACAITDTVDRAREVGQGIETVQSIATQFDESGAVETAQAIATDFDESGLKDTAQAVGTEIEESGARETVQTIATDIVVQPEDVPPDIPIMEGDKLAFVGSSEVITYTIAKDFQEVLAYYQSQMPLNGWTKVRESSMTDSAAELEYDKDGRKTVVILAEIPFLNQTSVIINLQ